MQYTVIKKSYNQNTNLLKNKIMKETHKFSEKKYEYTAFKT